MLKIPKKGKNLDAILIIYYNNKDIDYVLTQIKCIHWSLEKGYEGSKMVKNTGKNLRYLRENNTNQIIKYLTINHESSRIELSKQLGLSKMTITNIVSDLLERDYLVEHKAKVSAPSVSTGPKPMRLSIKDSRILAIGVYVSRERLHCSLCDIVGNELYIDEVDIDKKNLKENYNELICTSIQNILSYNPKLNQYIIGIGLSMIGLVDSEQGMLIKSTDFLGDHKIPIREILMERFPYPVFISNDMKASALAELIYGYGKDYNDFVSLGITYGVGAAVVSGGNVIKGKRGFGSEIGHMSVNYQGEMCACGNRGCLELYASIQALLKKTETSSLQELVKRIEDGNEYTTKVMKEFVDMMCVALTNIVNIFDPECVIFGHEGIVFVEKYMKRMEEYVNCHSIQSSEKKVKFKISMFRDIGGLRGSATLVFNKLFEGELSL